MTGRITTNWVTDVGLQYSANANRMERSNVALRYQPAIGKVTEFRLPLHAQYAGTGGSIVAVANRRALDRVGALELHFA